MKPLVKDNDPLLSLIDSLSVFSGITLKPAITALRMYISYPTVYGYSDFVTKLFAEGGDLSRCLFDALCEDENIYVKLRANGSEIPPVLATNVSAELGVLSRLSSVTPEELKARCGYDGYLADFSVSAIDFKSEYERYVENISKNGYGVYAKNVMFRVEDGEVVPVRSPDRTELNSLIAYERERSELIANTEALLAGRPAANTLLVGDAGTGKSSSVKAVVNRYASEGLRLVEMKKEQLHDIPSVMEELRENPLKFIIFIDDLSFNKNDDNFSALKAILEGSASVKAPNTVIYATSNRRHLVKETFSDREGDDIHRMDTMQELISLSDRFGLTILFTRPSKALYLEIVHGVSSERSVDMSDPEFDIKACAFALRKGGFTPRAAEQFVNSILASGGNSVGNT